MFTLAIIAGATAAGVALGYAMSSAGRINPARLQAENKALQRDLADMRAAHGYVSEQLASAEHKLQQLADASETLAKDLDDVQDAKKALRHLTAQCDALKDEAKHNEIRFKNESALHAITRGKFNEASQTAANRGRQIEGLSHELQLAEAKRERALDDLHVALEALQQRAGGRHVWVNDECILCDTTRTEKAAKRYTYVNGDGVVTNKAPACPGV